LDGANLFGARFSGETTWPAGFTPAGDLVWGGRGTDPRLTGKGKNAAAHDLNGLMARLHQIIDPGRMKRVLDMLKKEKQEIFFEVEPTLIRGIVRSHKTEDLYYSCVLSEKGDYSCATPDVVRCMGLSTEPCKHILVLVIGLVRANLIDPATVDRWLVAAQTKGPRWNKTVQNHVSDSLIKFKGVRAGEIDWRPTETIPEDFYAM
jgi:hypothetical protein